MSEARDFWSRRKAQVAEEAEAEGAALEARAIAEAQAEKSDAEILSDLGLPDPDDLCDGDDFSGFMARAVPERIRLRALRKLWLTNPVLANVDGLVDYGEDFTDAACVIENLQTTYQVGRGMTAHVEEMARQAELEAEGEDAAADAPEAEPIGDDELLAGGDADAPEAPGAAEAPTELAQMPPAEAGEMAPVPRRRMRFSFNDQPGEATSA